MQHFTKDDADLLDSAPRYRKRVLTPLARIHGPFSVETREGTLECPDGYLARDSQGWLYPVAKDEADAIYERIDP